MSPIKRIIQKIAGVELSVPVPIRMRAFGKLPAGTEYVQLDAGEGPAKIFPEWVKSGHDQWIERTARESRGTAQPTRLMLRLPGMKDQVIFAQVWPSHDDASPPRRFPFALFACVGCEALEDAAKIMAVGAQLWSHMEAAFWPIFDGDLDLSSLRERTLSSEIGRRPVDAPQWLQQAQQIQWVDWARTLAATVDCPGEAAFAARLERCVVQWKRQSELALRLPLSRDFDLLAQAAAWLAWLERVLPASLWTPRAVVLPHADAEGTPSLAIITRNPIPGDFQLLTTDRDIYHPVEDLRGPQRETGAAADLAEPGTSLWAWASGRQAPGD